MSQLRVDDAIGARAPTDGRPSHRRKRLRVLGPSEPAQRARRGRRGSVRLRAALVAIDAFSVVAGWLIADVLLDPSIPKRAGHDVRVVLFVLAVVPVALIANRALRLYRASFCEIRVLEIGSLARASGITAIVSLALAQVLDIQVADGWVALSALLSFVFLNVGRALYRLRLSQLRAKGRHHLRAVVIVGANDEAYNLWQLLEDHPQTGFRIVGVVGDRREYERHLRWAPLLGKVDEVTERVREAGATGVFIAPTALSSRQLNVVCRELLAQNVHVQIASSLKGIHQRRMTPHPVAHEAMFYVQPASSLSKRQHNMKRAFDLVVASLLLVAVLSVLAVTTLAVLVCDGRPIMFRQRRVGRNNKQFTIFKFRTMVPDAESRLIDLVDGNERDGPLFKLSADPRVTRLGRLLRETSIDELPQLLNVIGGTMSLVGPRPALPAETAQFDEELLTRHLVKPGMTGLWQVQSRDQASFKSYQRLDLFYVENWSLVMDISVLALTIPTVVLRALERTGSGRARKPRAASGRSKLVTVALATSAADEPR